MTRPGEAGGASTIFVISLAVVAVLFTALVVDTSRVLSASTAVGDVADAAGRAAAATVDPVAGQIVDPVRARDAATSLIASAGMTGDVQVAPREITVTVTQEVALPLLAVVGVTSRTVTETRRTVLQSAVTVP